MARVRTSLDEEKLSCSVCLELLSQPVTIPCGHSYCRGCIEDHWSGEALRNLYSCLQCGETFASRPTLVKNTVLSDLVEELKRNVVPETDAGPGDVSCDFCTGRKLKATRSCLQCLASYCQLHLEPHYNSPAFRKHKLVQPTAQIQENVCPRHGKVREIFCRTDRQCVCYLCSVEEHRGHDVASVTAERAEKQSQVGPARRAIQQRIRDRGEDLKLLQAEIENIDASADGAVAENQSSFHKLIELLEKRSSEVQLQIRSQQDAEVGRAREVQKSIQREIGQLRRNDAELEQLAASEDHCQFLLGFSSLSALHPNQNRIRTAARAPRYFGTLMEAVTDLTQNLQDHLGRDWDRVSQTKMDVLLTETQTEAKAEPDSEPELDPEQLPCVDYEPESEKTPLEWTEPEPVTYTRRESERAGSPVRSASSAASPPAYAAPEERDAFPPPVYNNNLAPASVYPAADPAVRAALLQYAYRVTLDPNTTNRLLLLSADNQRVVRSKKKQWYLPHPDRFVDRLQVLSKQSLTGRCYVEVEWTGTVSVALTYKSINRSGTLSGFGDNDKSWALFCHNNKFLHNRWISVLPGPQSSRIGVYLDLPRGILAFYSVSETATLLQEVQTPLTEPLYLGLLVSSGTAEILQVP